MSEGKRAIVTGSARGIGFAIARRLAQSGCYVLIADVDGQAAEQAAKSLQSEGCTVLPCTVDVRDPVQVNTMVKRALDTWGRVDILVSNAGVCLRTPIEEICPEEWHYVLSVNLTGAFLCCQAVIPTMRAQRSGKIILISSSAGQTGGLVVGVHYSASKAGLLGLTKALARALAPDIQVNAVAPGTTETSMTQEWGQDTLTDLREQIPAKRLGRPEDVAAAVAFLASSEADFITGHTLNVNGGLVMI